MKQVHNKLIALCISTSLCSALLSGCGAGSRDAGTQTQAPVQTEVQGETQAPAETQAQASAETQEQASAETQAQTEADSDTAAASTQDGSGGCCLCGASCRNCRGFYLWDGRISRTCGGKQRCHLLQF